MNRREFVLFNLAVAASLSGCGGAAVQSANTSASTTTSSSSTPANAATPSPTPISAPASLFPGFPDPPDLTAPGETPPTEVPNPAQVFGPDPLPLIPQVSIASNLDKFDHVVVLMMENRTLDQILGYLYPSGASPTGQPFNGVSGKNLSNPIPPYAVDANMRIVAVSQASGLQVPLNDPAEVYASVNLSFYDQFNPASNQFTSGEDQFAAPFNLPDGGATFPPPLNGFVKQFIYQLMTAYNIPSPTFAQYSTIMQCFPPNLVPVIGQLASAFAVCDNYNCAVPSQTWTNRSFFNAASSAGRVDNNPLLSWILPPGNNAPTIFDALTRAGRTWTIYYDTTDLYPLTRAIHYPTLSNYPLAAPHFKSMLEFYDDVDKGNLPDYAFMQPRFLLFNNSYHPFSGAPAVKRGEILMNDVYQAIRMSNSAIGSNYQNTLLFITFDEGGSCYDHVPPGPAAPPGDGYTPQFGFGFDRLGQRIPAILVSAWIDSGTVANSQFDATSLLKTMEDKWSLPPLTRRDANTNSVADILSRETPRVRAEWPRLRVRKLSADESASNVNAPLDEIGSSIVSAVNIIHNGKSGLPAGVTTVGDALTYLASLGPLP